MINHNKYSFIVFIDRDGTIIEDVGYPHKISQLELLPNSKEGLNKIKKSGAVITIISNQSGINRGFFDIGEVNNFNAELLKRINDKNKIIDEIYICPHLEKDQCKCRKPKILNLILAAKKFNIPLAKSIMIGDKKSDIQTGINAKIPTILISSKKINLGQNFTCNNLKNASKIINKIVAENNWIQ